MKLSKNQLKKIIAEELDNALEKDIKDPGAGDPKGKQPREKSKLGIDTPEEASHFYAQLAIESVYFSQLAEMSQVGKGKMTYYGRGLIQLTGYKNYNKFQKEFNIPMRYWQKSWCKRSRTNRKRCSEQWAQVKLNHQKLEGTVSGGEKLIMETTAWYWNTRVRSGPGSAGNALYSVNPQSVLAVTSSVHDPQMSWATISGKKTTKYSHHHKASFDKRNKFTMNAYKHYSNKMDGVKS